MRVRNLDRRTRRRPPLPSGTHTTSCAASASSGWGCRAVAEWLELVRPLPLPLGFPAALRAFLALFRPAEGSAAGVVALTALAAARTLVLLRFAWREGLTGREAWGLDCACSALGGIDTTHAAGRMHRKGAAMVIKEDALASVIGPALK